MAMHSEESDAFTKGGVPKALLRGMKPVQRINFNVTAEEFHQLKVYAAIQGTTVSKIFRKHIAELAATVEAWTNRDQ